MKQDMDIICDNLGVQLGDFTALEGVSCRIPARSFCVVYGPNGAGKTTFFKVLQGIQSSTTGSVRLAGRAPADLSVHDVAVVPQIKKYARSFPARSIDLVASGIRGRWPWRISASERERCMDALDEVGIAHLAERQLGALSGGEMQRVYVARVLVRQARLVLLDEPATGMDVAAEKDLSHLLENYQARTNATILMISHDWDTAQHHASHILLLNHQMHWFGAIADGPSEEAMRNAFGHIGHSHSMQHAGSHGRCDSHEHNEGHEQSVREGHNTHGG